MRASLWTPLLASLLVAHAAGAAIILSVEMDPADPTPELDLRVDIQLIGVSGGGLAAIGFDIVSTLGAGAIYNAQGYDFASLVFSGVQPDGTNAGWGDFSGGPTDGTFTGILTFSAVSCPTAFFDCLPGGPNLYAADDAFDDITSTITVEVPLIPEPATALLLAGGLGALAMARRRRNR